MICKICGFSYNKKKKSCPNCYPFNHSSSRGERELYDLLATSGIKIIQKSDKIDATF